MAAPQAQLVSVQLCTTSPPTLYRTRPAFQPLLDAIVSGEYVLQKDVNVQPWTGRGADRADGAPVIPASVVHAVKAALTMNASEPDALVIWEDAQALQTAFLGAGELTLVVPAGVSETGKRGKNPARHVRTAVSRPAWRRWDLQKARSPVQWFGDAADDCVGLGLLVYHDAVVLDFDDLDDEARLQRFEALMPLFGDAPLEFTRSGVHVFFRTTPHSRASFPTVRLGLLGRESHVDWLTVSEPGTPAFVAIAPTLFKRPLPGRQLGKVPMPGISDGLVDALLKLRLANDCGPSRPPVCGKRARDVAATHPRPEVPCFLAHIGCAMATALFESVGLSKISSVRYSPRKGGSWRAKSEGPCCMPGCTYGRPHTDTWTLRLHPSSGSLVVSYWKRQGLDGHTFTDSDGNEKQMYKFAVLSLEMLVALHGAWRAHNALPADWSFELRRCDGAGGGVTWRDFTPWAQDNRNPIRVQEGEPAAPWMLRRDGALRSMPAPWYDVRDRRVPAPSAFLGEHGPVPAKPGGDRDAVGFAYGWRFISAAPCTTCGQVHDGVWSVKTPADAHGAAVLFAPCGTSGERIHAVSTWFIEEGEELAERLEVVRGATDWAGALEAAIALLDWSHTKAGYYAKYRSAAVGVFLQGETGDGFALRCRSKDAWRPPFDVRLHKRHMQSRVGVAAFHHTGQS